MNYSKAYDRIPRRILWSKLEKHGIQGKLLSAIQSLYANVKCAVNVNSYRTDWFGQNIGLKQGCLLSTTLFNLFLNDLSLRLNQSGIGVHIEEMIINHLLYADDLVLIAETESDLQILLDILGSWCTSNKMTINTNKSKIMHFRNTNVVKTNYRFTCNKNELECVTEYRYLGLVLLEFLDYSVTAKYVSKSATRALGLLISKF